VTTPGISHRDRRTLIVGALSMGSIVAAGRGLPALRAWESSRTTAATEARDQLALAETGAGRLREVRDSATARWRRLNALRSPLLSGATPEAAASTLASLLEKLADEEGVDVETVMLRPDSVVRFDLVRVAVRLTAESDVEGLLGFLFAVETQTEPLAIRELSVTQPEPAALPSKPEALRFEVVVQTLARVKSKAATKERGR
jgi:type II secretion system (T2SS) protein M